VKVERTTRQRLVFIVRTALLILVPLLLILPCALGYGFINLLTGTGCGGEINPDVIGLAYEDASFRSSEFGRDIPAYWIPASPGDLTVIVVPTGGAAARGDRMSEIEVYHRAGVNVLTFSARGCIGTVNNSLGYLEVDAVGDALTYLQSRSDINRNQIGLHGFSAGGATVIMAAARFAEDVAWAVSEGGYHDFPAQIEQNAPYALPFGMGLLFRVGAHIGYRVTIGHDMSVLSPVSVIDEIESPVLLIYGTLEPGLEGAREMARVGGENVELWEVEGATHGSYINTAPNEYAQQIREFLTTENTENAE